MSLVKEEIFFHFNEYSYLIVVQTSYHNLRKDDNSRPTHPGTAVDHHGWVDVLWITDAVCVSPHRLDLLQVHWRTKKRQQLRINYTIEKQ